MSDNIEADWRHSPGKDELVTPALLRKLVREAGGEIVWGRGESGWTADETKWIKPEKWLAHSCLFCGQLIRFDPHSGASRVEFNLKGLRWLPAQIEGFCSRCVAQLSVLVCKRCSKKLSFTKYMPRRLEALTTRGLCEKCAGVPLTEIRPRQPSKLELKMYIKTLPSLLGEAP